MCSMKHGLKRECLISWMPELSLTRCSGALPCLFHLLPCILYQIHPVLGIAFFSSQYVAELLQSTIHEWYHNPVRNRKTFYSAPVYWAFTFLEKTGLASTQTPRRCITDISCLHWTELRCGWIFRFHLLRLLHHDYGRKPLPNMFQGKLI